MPEPAPTTTPVRARGRGPAARVGRAFWSGVRGVLAAGPATLALGMLAGIAVRLTLQDRAAFLAPVFYATPPPALALAGLASALGWLALRRRALAACVGGLALACGVWTWATMWRSMPPGAVRGPVQRVIFWNAARGMLGWHKIAAELGRRDADLIMLNESGAHAALAAKLWAAALPERRLVLAGGGLTLLARAEVEQRGAGPLGSYEFGLYQHVIVHFENGDLHVVQVDVDSHPLKPRFVALRALRTVLDGLAGERVLVVGDFNTPSDSHFFGPLRRDFRNAFESAGRGYAATWPTPLPLLAIDQAWHGPGVEVLRCEHIRSWASDHALLALDIALTEPALAASSLAPQPATWPAGRPAISPARQD